VLLHPRWPCSTSETTILCQIWANASLVHSRLWPQRPQRRRLVGLS